MSPPRTQQRLRVTPPHDGHIHALLAAGSQVLVLTFSWPPRWGRIRMLGYFWDPSPHA